MLVETSLVGAFRINLSYSCASFVLSQDYKILDRDVGRIVSTVSVNSSPKIRVFASELGMIYFSSLPTNL